MWREHRDEAVRGWASIGLRAAVVATATVALMATRADAVVGEGEGGMDRIAKLQAEYAADPAAKRARAYHFGSQGPRDVFSNHTSHSNRLVPVYLFGRKADLKSVMGEQSRYRKADEVKTIYGFLPKNTVNPLAEYADQSDLYRVQKDAIARGVKHLFIVWFDGMDWPTTQAAAIAKTGKVYNEGKGSGLVFQDYDAGGAAQFGYVVTSPTHDKNEPDLDRQTVVIPSNSLGGGYDAEIAGPNPWTLGPLGPKAPGYIKGSSTNADDRAGIKSVGRVRHAYTDSSQSAAEMISGVKSYNNGLNVTDDGRLVSTLFHELQGKGWKVGTVTSVPFDHASPAAMYAQNVHRDDYQDLARAMLGLPGILQKARQAPLHPGLDVVIGCGFGIESHDQRRGMSAQGENWKPGNLYLADDDLTKIDVRNGGRYIVVHTEKGTDGGEALLTGARNASKGSVRLFGFFGREGLDHLPYRTADGRYDPVASLGRGGKPGPAEHYTRAELREQPTLAEMTDAALTVLADDPARPFALFIEAGDVDFALHANNLDNAIGAVYSGEEAVQKVIRWVETHSNWDDSMLLVSADHGHYLVIDDPQTLAGQ